ncbi:MAG: hypothetical protein Q8M07_06970 [Prosthecobacter sp.]|nr:hypothetical protein [Prosthecobacter sp.]
MTAVAAQLDRMLEKLPAAAAASVERLVWDVLNVVELQPQTPRPASDHEADILAHQAHWQKVDAMLDELDWSDFERPPQGESEVREDW